MHVLFMKPNYRANSEPWMRRTLDGIRDHLAGIAAVEIDTPDPALADIPHHQLSGLKRGRNFLGTLAPGVVYRPKKLERFIEEQNITHVICNFGTLAVEYLTLFQKLDLPIFVSFHGYDATFELREHDGSIVHRPGYRAAISELSHCCRFITNSEYTKGHLVEAGIDAGRIDVNPLGVDPAPKPKVHENSGSIQVLSVGRLIECKAPNLAIEAFDHAVSSGVDAQLTIVGDGPLQDSLEKLAGSLPSNDRIRFAGVLPPTEVDRYLDSTDIYIQHNILGPVTQREEAYGVSILEAIAKGIPAICTNSGGVPEVVGSMASELMTEPGDVEAQGDLLAKFAREPELRTEVGKRSWEWVKESRSSKLEAERLLKILESGS